MSRGLPAGVLDTNVLMVLSGELQTYDWHAALDERPDEHVIIWIPIAVVDELDRHKRDRTPMFINGEKTSRRTLARLALRTLDEMFDDPRSSFTVEQATEPIGQKVSFRLLMEEPGHIRLPSADAEVIDRAAGLLAFGGRVRVVTFDTGMRLKARSADLLARQLPEPEDD